MKKGQVLAIVSVAVGLLMVPDRVLAHHSDAVNDQTRVVTITGTVTKVVFADPHAQIHLEVKDDKGNVAQWVCTGGGPSALRKVGWSSMTIKAGEQLTITGFPYKDGRTILLWLKLVRADGEVIPLSIGETERLARFLAIYGDQPGLGSPKQ